MDLSRLTPSDAVVTLRSFERRYRGLFADLEEGESPDDLARRPGDGGWSAIEHIVSAARGIAGSGRALAAILQVDGPQLDVADVRPASLPRPHQPSGTVHERLAELGFEANAAADRIDNTPAADWDRTGTLAGTGRTVTALDLARGAVDAGVTHLRAAEEVLHTVRRSS
jgi:hypothetical protein